MANEQNAANPFDAFFEGGLPPEVPEQPVSRHQSILHEMQNLADELEAMWTVKDAIHVEDGNSVVGPTPRAEDKLLEIQQAITAIRNEYLKAGKW